MNTQSPKPDPTLKYLTMLQSQYDKKLKDYEMAMKEYTMYKNTFTADIGSIGAPEQYFQMANTPRNLDLNQATPTGSGDGIEKELSVLLKKLKEEKGLVVMKNKVFWGEGKDKTTFVRSAQACKKKCEKRDTCSGASFIKRYPNSKRGGCYLRTGMGKVRTREGGVAMVNQFMVLIAKLKHLNARLLRINQKILTANTQWKRNDLDSWRDATYEMEDKTTDRHNELVDQREILDNMLQEYDSISVGLGDTQLGTTQSLLWYRIFILLLLFIVLAGIVVVTGIPVNILTSAWLVVFVLWFLGFTYLAVFLLVIYILYYIYSVPM